tara:strand:+ start:296 stop:880 length:585 start_codon:yes stop_codon:yes gene_type:complete
MNIDINYINDILEENSNLSLDLKNKAEMIESFSAYCFNSLKKGKKILICGNGGSASDSNHFAAELVGRFEIENRESLPAISLCSNQSTITAIANDFGFNKVFSKQIEAIGNKDDVLIAISTSGKSKNVLEAIDIANLKNIKVIILTGKDGGKYLRNKKCEILEINSRKTARIQEMHILILHIICFYIDNKIAND